MSSSISQSVTHRSTLIRLLKETYTLEFRVIVVLGARISARGSPSNGLLRRLQAAYTLVEREMTGILLLSGGASSGKFVSSEADVMEQVCITKGMPLWRLWREGESLNTRQNAARCWAVLGAAEAAGVPLATSLSVVTEWPHLPRAWLIFSALNWRGARQGLWQRRPVRMVAAAGPPSGWSTARFVLREGVGFLADFVRLWWVPLIPLAVSEADPFVILEDNPFADSEKEM